jgi:hypothetical protein
MSKQLITKALRNEGEKICEKTVGNYMREMGCILRLENRIYL